MLSQLLLLLLNLLDCSEAVHDWHLQIHENHFVARLATNLSHVGNVLVDCDLSIFSLVALFAEFFIDYGLLRNNVERNIVY